MSRRIAPLNALRAFEAAARHLSFTRAAEELHVTPAAISHQIKQLEEYFATALFRRLTRSLMLTDEGQALLPPLRDGFDLLATACGRVRSFETDRLLTVSAAPSLAGRWLVARLERFRAANPEIDLRLDATDRLTDFERDGVDIAIRYGGGGYPGLHVERLFETNVFPVCSPAFAAGPPPLRTPDDLAGRTLLHSAWASREDTWPNWRMWLLAAGVAEVEADRGPRFNDVGMAMQTAIDGHGIALTSTVLAADDLAAGRLMAPFDLCVPMNFCYFLVCPRDTANAPKITAFRTWVMAEAAATIPGQ